MHLLQGDDVLSASQYPQTYIGLEFTWLQITEFPTDQHLNSPTGKWSKPSGELAQKFKLNLFPAY